VANEGCLKLFAYQLTGNQDFLHSALADMNYLLGCNATGYCFVTGFGVQQAKRIHHRPSQADGIEAPIPGFLVGGPNLVTFADCPGDKTRDRKYPAKSYADQSCSYSTNEIAINWNAPMAYLSGALDAGKW
jgi:endoglucanase